MNIRNNKGVNLISLIITVIMLLTITGAIMFNTKNHILMRKINSLNTDIELLNSKIDEYYLKYGELPELCSYVASKTQFSDIINSKANAKSATLNEEINPDDGDEYVVIDLERLGGITLKNGYENTTSNREYFTIKENQAVTNQDKIYVINKKTHQIYFPHGLFADGIMYYRD